MENVATPEIIDDPQLQLNITYSPTHDTDAPLDGAEVGSCYTLATKPSPELVEILPACLCIQVKRLPLRSKETLLRALNSWARWHTEQAKQGLFEECLTGTGTLELDIHNLPDQPTGYGVWKDKVAADKRKRATDVNFNQVYEQENNVPKYDRAVAFGLGMEGSLLSPPSNSNGTPGKRQRLNQSRCFNCGSYSHALKDCTKPHNRAAVDAARREMAESRPTNTFKGKANATSRYFTEAEGGGAPDELAGLKRGVLSSELRLALGLSEGQDPPWKQRLLVLGPLPIRQVDMEVEEEEQPITIYGDGEEDGEVEVINLNAA